MIPSCLYQKSVNVYKQKRGNDYSNKVILNKVIDIWKNLKKDEEQVQCYINSVPASLKSNFKQTKFSFFKKITVTVATNIAASSFSASLATKTPAFYITNMDVLLRYQWFVHCSPHVTSNPPS